MSVKAVKGLVWLAVIIVLAMVIVAVSPLADAKETRALVLGAAVLAVATSVWYWRSIPQAEANDEQRHEALRAEAKQRIQLTGESYAVKARSGGLALLAFMAMPVACGFMAFATPDAEMIGLFAISIVLGLFAALMVLPMLGRPALTIRREGIDVPLYGFFRWSEIEAIDVTSETNRGVEMHVLEFDIPTLSEREAQLSPVLRVRRSLMRRSRQNVLTLARVFTSLPGLHVYGLCYELWREQTGRTSLPARRFDKMNVVRAEFEELSALGKRIEEAAAANPAEAMRLVEELQRKFPIEAPPGNLSRTQQAYVDTLMKELATLDPHDEAARKRVKARHMRVYVRRFSFVAFVLIAVGFAVVMTIVALLS